MKKVLFVASAGGHFSELMQLKPMFKKYNSYFITDQKSAMGKLKRDYPNHAFSLIYGTRSHLLPYILIFPINVIKSFFLYLKIRPKYIITTGVHTAVPICYIGKLFGSKIIYIETFANMKTKGLTGKLLYPIANLFLVQWESMLKVYPKAKYIGKLF